MRTVSKWGNSLALRIPATFAEMVGLEEGTEVDLKVSAGSLIVKPVRRKFALKQLVAQITPENRHREIEWGRPVGKEKW
jgi:antitoxin MazE